MPIRPYPQGTQLARGRCNAPYAGEKPRSASKTWQGGRVGHETRRCVCEGRYIFRHLAADVCKVDPTQVVGRDVNSLALLIHNATALPKQTH
jgi:hypothetical protein